MIIDLSLDFDFFCREDPMWDFGHDEDNLMLQTNAMWDMRYATMDLHALTDQKEHVGFTSRELFSKLLQLGFNFERYKLSRESGFADSHKLAFNFLRNPRVIPDVILNIDAHHDAFPGNSEQLHCGNWIPRLLNAYAENKQPAPQVWQVYPQWKNPRDDAAPSIGFDFFGQWNDFCDFIEQHHSNAREPLFIRKIFLCRSGTWVPPHFENDFVELARRIVAMSKRAPMLESIIKRDATTSVQAEQMRADFNEKMKELSVNTQEAEDSAASPE